MYVNNSRKYSFPVVLNFNGSTKQTTIIRHNGLKINRQKMELHKSKNLVRHENFE